MVAWKGCTALTSATTESSTTSMDEDRRVEVVRVAHRADIYGIT